MRKSLRWALLCSLCIVSYARTADAQTVANYNLARITTEMVVGSSTFGDSILRVVGSSSVSTATGTVNPVVADSDGDFLEDTFTTVSTAGAYTWSGAGSFTSTLGVTGVLSGNTGTLLVGDTRVTGTTPSLWLHDSDAASSEKYTALEANTGILTLKLYDDTPSSANTVVTLDRTGLVPDDWRWGSLLSTIRCENNGGCALGSYPKMYSTMYVWDLVAITLTAKEVVSTVGGEVIIAPTTSLTRDVASGDAGIFVKHNNLRANDTVILKVNGSGEKMLVTSSYTDCSVSGNCSIAGTDYAYSVTRNRQGSGAKNWLSGTAVVSEGNVGDGLMSLFADRSSSIGDGYVGFVISDGPVAYWRMNATTATTSNDMMGNVPAATESGTQSNGLGVGTFGVGSTGADPAWQNTGGAGALTVADDADLRITADLTIEFIANWEHTLSRGEHILSRVFNGEYYVDVDAAGVLRFCHGNGTTSECEVTTSAVMVVGGWHHYAIVRDAVSTPKRILFYVDGVLVTTATYTQTVTTSTNTLRIGDTASGTTQFDGYIDEVAIYNYQLAADRILLHSQARTNDSISRFTIGPTILGLVRTGTGAFDLSERWVLGNVAGTFGYSSTTPVYGFAAGNPSADWVSVDATNGYRNMYGSDTKLQAVGGNLSLTGDLSIGTSGSLRSGATAYDTTTGYWLDYNSGSPRFRIGTTSAGTSYLRWTGSALEMKSSTLTVDANGITMTPNSAANYANLYGYKFSTAIGSSEVGVFSYEEAGGRSLALLNRAVSPGRLVQSLVSAGGSGGSATMRVFDDNAGGVGGEFLTPNAHFRLANTTLVVGGVTTTQINSLNAVSATITLPCGTVTFTQGWLTAKTGTC
jgi:hypothetical protein